MTRAEFGAALVQAARGAAAIVHRAGFHEISPWWWATLTMWLLGTWRQLVLRVGRRGGKSSSLCLLAVVWSMVYPASAIPLGDVGVIAFVSVDRREVNGRLDTVEALLRALGIEHTRRGDSIELIGRPIRFQAFTASVSGVSGFTCILAICDEVAKWRDSDTNANPATHVLSSLRPTMATQPLARTALSSSCVSNLDAHAKAFDQGTTDFQMVAAATTWEANPNISEADTEELEPDPKIRGSEYGNVPRSAVSGAFDADHIARCFRRPAMLAPQGVALTLVDASGGKGDAFVWGHAHACVTERHESSMLKFDAITGKESPEGTVIRTDPTTGRPYPNPHFGKETRAVVLRELHAIEGKFYETVQADAIARRIAATAKKYRSRRCVGDQFASLAMRALLNQVGLRLEEQPFSSESKQRAVLRVRDWMREEHLILPLDAEGDAMKRELLSFEEQITASGNVRYQGRRNTHDDRVSILLQLAMADIAGELRGSPTAHRGRARIEQSESAYTFG